MEERPQRRWQTDGKFFRLEGVRVRPRMITYGPFPGGWPRDLSRDFQRIAGAGFRAIRTYRLPERFLMDEAARAGLGVFAGLDWEQNADFLTQGTRLAAARIRLTQWLGEQGDHPALAAVYVGNEIPADLVRWMGEVRVREALEELIHLGKQSAPGLLLGYANFPSTEFLEPGNADFTAFNLYLEEETALERYLARLHHVAGDRPLVISEFGLDSRRNGLARQAELLGRAAAICEARACAGFTVFAWSDRWLSGGLETDDWDFGVTDRDGNDKPALAALSLREPAAGHPDRTLAVTVIVCTRNGRDRIGRCLSALVKSACRHRFEVLVVDDGSTDGTADYVESRFPGVTVVRVRADGLSAARNAGAQAAAGDVLAYTDDDCVPDRDWLQRVVDFLVAHPEYAAVGGPNLPQHPSDWREAVVCAAPGAPGHVMLDDDEAEHLPGCNLVIRKSAFERIGGFDRQFHTAGDDVDFCWRLQDAGLRLGFDPGAFVWHWRRPSIRPYVRQQIGYGKAERLLLAKHPGRFSRGATRWKGIIYGGGPVRVTDDAVIYRGPADRPHYHPQLDRIPAMRDIDDGFNRAKARLALRILGWFTPAIRAWHRTGRWRAFLPGRAFATPTIKHGSREWFLDQVHRDQIIRLLNNEGWMPCKAEEGWDLRKQDTRVLIATELGERGGKRSLIRVEGDFGLLQAGLASLAPCLEADR